MCTKFSSYIAYVRLLARNINHGTNIYSIFSITTVGIKHIELLWSFLQEEFIQSGSFKKKT